jgi:hypothetical protein
MKVKEQADKLVEEYGKENAIKIADLVYDELVELSQVCNNYHVFDARDYWKEVKEAI